MSTAGGPDAEGTDGPLAHVRHRLAERRAAGLWRELSARPAAEPDVLDLASNNYLGLAGHPRVTKAAAEATLAWGAGATASQLVTGHTEAHAELEEALASFVGTPAALTFSSGYLANLGAVSALADEDTLVISDTANHASIIDACRLSRAQVAVVGHRDVAAVTHHLRSRSQQRALVVTDAVFSVDGDLAPLADLHAACRSYGAVLLVDEAHSLGVVGPGGHGAAAAAGIAGEPDVVLTVTLSKALGSQGGAVLGAPEIRDLLINIARPLIFDTGPAPGSAAAATEAIRIVSESPDLPERARANAVRLATLARGNGLAASRPDGAVVAIPMGSAEAALAGRRVFANHHARVGCFRPPSVPPGASCLRLTASATLDEAHFARVAAALAEVARETYG